MPLDKIKHPDKFPIWMHEALRERDQKKCFIYSCNEKRTALRECRRFRTFRKSLQFYSNHILAKIEKNFELRLSIVAEEDETLYSIYLTFTDKKIKKDYEVLASQL